jgi:hypothetical protein
VDPALLDVVAARSHGQRRSGGDAVPAGTTVRLEQRGWDKLGETTPPVPHRRERTGQVWGQLTAVYVRACG